MSMSHPATAHPRLYFGPEDIGKLREKRTRDPLAAAAWTRVEALAQAGMECPGVEWQPRWEWDKGESGQESLGGALSRVAHLAAHLAFAYLIAGEESYGRKAADLMLSVCRMDYWTSPAFFQPPYDPPWRGTLETAGIVQWIAYGYDWLYDFLSPEDRDRIRLNIAYKGIMPLIQDWADPSTRLPVATHIKPWGNWWVNCIAPAGAAALAIYGEERTERWETGWPLARPAAEEETLTARWARLVKEAMDWFWRFEGGSVPKLEKELFWEPEGTYYPPNFDSEGAYAEGLNYLDSVLIHSFRYSEARLRVLGGEILPLDLMGKVADFILYGCVAQGGRMRSVNFDDTRANHAANPQLTAFLASKLRHPYMQWYFHASQENFGDASWFKLGESPVFTFLWYDPSLAPEEPRRPAPVKVFPGAGWGVMRTGWGPKDTLLAVKCGNTAGHAHADAGTFLLYHAGEPLVIDSGTSSYVIPEWHTYYHTTRAHSTVMIGGLGQEKRLAGRIAGDGGVPGCALIVLDATKPYEGILRWFARRVCFLGQRYYCIVDELAKGGLRPASDSAVETGGHSGSASGESLESIATSEPGSRLKSEPPPVPGRLEWLLHYDGYLTTLDEGAFLIERGPARLLVRMIEPARVETSVEQGFRATHEDPTVVQTPEEKRAALERAEYLKVCPVLDKDRQVFLTLLYPFVEGESIPQILPLKERNWVGIQVCRGGNTDFVVFRGPGAPRTGLGIMETDAKLVVLSLDQNRTVQGCAMDYGTFLRVNGTVVPLRAAGGTVAVLDT